MKPMTYAEIGEIWGVTGQCIRSVEFWALHKIRSRLHDLRRETLFDQGIDIYHGLDQVEKYITEPTQPSSPWDEPGEFRMLGKLISKKARHFWKRRGRNRAPHLSETFSTTPQQLPQQQQ